MSTTVLSPEISIATMVKRPIGRPRRYIAIDHIRELRSQGLSFRQIARKTGCGYGTVRRAYLNQR